MTVKIRLATGLDAGEILQIYAPIVSDTAISFEVIPPTLLEMQKRMLKVLSKLPWLVCEDGSGVLGYCYASVHRARAAYRWSVDTSIYIHEGARRRGIGQALYRALFQALKLQGYYNACAGISLPNPASVALHEALGFEAVGVYRKVGYLMGQWRDVGWWQLTLQEHTAEPQETLPLAAVVETSVWNDTLAAGQASIRN